MKLLIQTIFPTWKRNYKEIASFFVDSFENNQLIVSKDKNIKQKVIWIVKEITVK